MRECVRYSDSLDYNGYTISEKRKNGMTDGFVVRPVNTENNSSNRYYSVHRDVDDAKITIDELNKGMPFLDEARYDRYVRRYNQSHLWKIPPRELKRLLKLHRNSDLVMQTLIEERLEDANYHAYVALLDKKDYDGYEDLLNGKTTAREVLAKAYPR